MSNSHSDINCALPPLSALHSKEKMKNEKLENNEPRSQLELENSLGKKIAKQKFGDIRDNFEIKKNCSEKGVKVEGETPVRGKTVPENLTSGVKLGARLKDTYKQRHLSQFLTTFGDRENLKGGQASFDSKDRYNEIKSGHRIKDTYKQRHLSQYLTTFGDRDNLKSGQASFVSKDRGNEIKSGQTGFDVQVDNKGRIVNNRKDKTEEQKEKDKVELIEGNKIKEKEKGGNKTKEGKSPERAVIFRRIKEKRRCKK